MTGVVNSVNAWLTSKPADHRVAERLTDLRARPVTEHQRYATEHRRHRGHHDRAEAQDGGLPDRLRADSFRLALGHDGEVDQHDAVLLHDADEQNDADQRDQAEIEAEQHQCRERTDAGRGQRGEDRDRVDVALVENAEDEVDDDQCRDDQERHRESECWNACALP